jgi:hypothetical protein
MTPEQIGAAQASDEASRASTGRAFRAAAEHIGEPEFPAPAEYSHERFIAAQRARLDDQERGLRGSLDHLKKEEQGGLRVAQRREAIERQIKALDRQRKALGEPK